MQTVILWAILSFAIFSIVGILVVKFGTDGFRTLFYNDLSAALVAVGAPLAYLVENQSDFQSFAQAIGLTPGTITVCVVTAKAADWMMHRWLRFMTTGPVPPAPMIDVGTQPPGASP